MNLYNPLRFFYFHLLLLQLEEYDTVRFIKAILNTRGIPPGRDFRKPLKFTGKIKLITALSSLSVVCSGLFFSQFLPALGIKIIGLALCYALVFYFSYFFLIIINILIYPVDLFIKGLTINGAKNKIKKLKNLKIIGIAGSYGKTGMKDFITTVLAEKYQVVKTPESVNTPVGIAQTILKKINDKTEIFVVEMGEYYAGDIKNICQIAHPDIAVITGINEAHLERLKSIDNTIKTIFEAAENMDQNGVLLLNNKDKNIKNNYKKFVLKQSVYFYQAKGKIEFNEDAPGFVYQSTFLPVLGRYNLDKLDGVIHLAKQLDLTETEIAAGLKKIRTPAHRLQPIFNREKNILVIDDSYNGNPDGVEEAIKTLSLFKKRRKIFITPGLVETGDRSGELHRRIGHTLNDVVDLVILVKNSVTPDIESGLLEVGFNKENIIWYDSMLSLQNNLSLILKSGDVVLFQNDWPDNYV